MAFYQKYRSKNFHEMIGQSHVVQTLLESVKSDKLVHAYLLTGPRGIGKTSIARLLAKAINCQSIIEARKNNKPTTGEPCNKCQSCRDISAGVAIDIVEIDAASHTGVDDIRELIEKARLLPSKLFKKVYIIDEVHMLSRNAFNALLKTLEEPPSHVVFILATTEIHRIPATVLSRAQRFDFKRARREEIIANLKKVAGVEKIEIDSGSLDLIAVSAAGAHRDALSLLEQVAATTNKITVSATRQILGLVESEEVYKFIGAIFNNHPEEGLKIAHELYERGLDLAEFNRNIIAKLRQILLLEISSSITIEETKEDTTRLMQLAELSTESKTLRLIEIFLATANLLKEVSSPILPLEMAIVKAGARFNENPKSEIRNPKQNPNFEIQNSKQIQDQNITTVIPADAGIQVAQTSKGMDPGSPATGRDDKPSTNSNEQIEKSENEKIVTCPVPVLAMTKDIWFQIIEETKKQNATLAALLRDAKPEKLTSDVLTIGVKFKFHKERISEAKYSQILSKIISKVIGNNCRIVCRISDGKAKLAEKIKTEDLSKVAAEVFEIE